MNKKAFLISVTLCISFISISLYAQDYTHDSLAVRAILDSNGLDVVTVESVVDSIDGRIWRLNLNAKDLTSLPPEIGNLTNLVSLELRSNNLAGLPPEVGNLTKLTRLYLAFNDLSSLPPEIGNLTDLRVLYLFFNDLTSLPPEIGNLTNLAELDLEGNTLTSLPSEIGNCTNLSFLSCIDNQLTALPSEIGNLKSLTTLCLPFNDLAGLPDSIVHITPTGKLDLGYNKLDTGNLSDTVIAWLDEYDPDWRGTQNVPIIYHPDVLGNKSSVLLNVRDGLLLFSVPCATFVNIRMYTVKGRFLSTLVDSYKQTGTYTVHWDSGRYGSGMYYLKLSNGNNCYTKKVLIVK